MINNKFFRNNVSFTLILINVVIYLFQIAVPKITTTFMLTSNIVWQQPWTLITAMFLHGSFSHLLFNMYALLLFGPLIERKIGKKRFLILYFVAGFFASLAALYYPAALGASGAIMGVLGMVIMLFPDLKVLFFFIVPMSMRTAGIIFALMDLFGFFAGGSGVAHLSHLAGLSIGLIYGFYLIHKKREFQTKFTSGNSFFSKKNSFSNFKSSSSLGKSSSNSSRTSKSNFSNSSSGETIELTKDDLDKYYKYGKL